MSSQTTVVVGLDGGHFELIDRWIESGTLSNIADLVDGGVSADLHSCLPPVTSPNWKCYSSGQNPAEFGIFWWENIDTDRRQVHYPSDRKAEPTELWERLGAAGEEVCVIGTPLTYPPKEVNGVLVAGGVDSAGRDFTHPPSLESRLRRDFEYRVHPSASMEDEPERASKEIHELIESRFKLALDLMDKNEFDFVQITTFYINVLQHFLWDDEATKRGWEIVDEYIGRLRNRSDVGNIVLMSDHGSNEIETVFNVNTWLRHNGYLEYNTRYKVVTALSERGVHKRNMERISDALGLTQALKRTLPDRFIDTLPSGRNEIKKSEKTEMLDWDRSVAVGSGQGPVYVMDESVIDDLQRELADLKAPDGTELFRAVHRKEEVYSGRYLDEAPELVLDQAPNVHIRGGLGRDQVFESPSETGWAAENKREGLFVAHGPDFGTNAPDEISILQLAPTILELYDIDVPAEMDEEPLREVLADGR